MERARTQDQRGNAAAALAKASILAASTGPLGTTQLPPTHLTKGSASHLGALSAVIPPVGQNRAICKGAASAFNAGRSEEHTSELQSLMRISYAVFCLKKKTMRKKNKKS